MVRALAAMLLILALPAAAFAEESAIAAETDKVMWCASAFYWLAGNADDAGDAAEAELYDGWATELTQRGTMLLSAAGVDLARIQEIIGEYDQLVLDELASSKTRYDVAVCPQLMAE